MARGISILDGQTSAHFQHTEQANKLSLSEFTSCENLDESTAMLRGPSNVLRVSSCTTGHAR
jgi:hypothetical protein